MLIIAVILQYVICAIVHEPNTPTPMHCEMAIGRNGKNDREKGQNGGNVPSRPPYNVQNKATFTLHLDTATGDVVSLSTWDHSFYSPSVYQLSKDVMQKYYIQTYSVI